MVAFNTGTGRHPCAVGGATRGPVSLPESFFGTLVVPTGGLGRSCKASHGVRGAGQSVLMSNALPGLP
eukprot:15447223-Alexandrium_andersonii.AAC.1